MKIHAVLFLLLFCIIGRLNAQCDYNQLIDTGRVLYRSGDYRQALMKFNAARLCNKALAGAVDREIQKVLAAIEKQRDQDIASRIEADSLRHIAELAQLASKEAKQKTDSLLFEQKKAIEFLEQQTIQVWLKEQISRTLVDRGQLLLRNVSEGDTAAFDALFRQGLAFYAVDPQTHKRDYNQTRIYFSLARFVRSDASLDVLIQATDRGEFADSLFYAGAIADARQVYETLAQALAVIGIEPDYELLQIQRIDILEQKTNALTGSGAYYTGGKLVLDGDWWTIPRKLLDSDHVHTVVLRNNATIVRSLPAQLDLFSRIDTLIVERCANFTGLDDWLAAQFLTTIILDGNPRLRELRFDRALPELTTLTISNHPELVTIYGFDALPSLKSFFLVNNPLFTVLSPALAGVSLEQLVLNGGLIEHINLSDVQLPGIRSLEITALKKLQFIAAGQSYPGLQYLTLKDLPLLDSLSGFNDLPALRELVVLNTKLKSLKHMSNLPLLENITISGNPEFVEFPNASAVSRVRSIRLIDNPGFSLGRNDNEAFLKRIGTKRIKGNGAISARSINLKWSRINDTDSDRYYKGEYIEKDFSGPFALELALKMEPYSVSSSLPLEGFFGFQLNYLNYEGSTGQTDTYWEADRLFIDGNGLIAAQVLTVPGHEWVDIDIVNLGFQMGLSTRADKFVQFYGYGGFGLLYRFPGKVGLRIGDLAHEEKVNGRVMGSIMAGVGLSLRIRQLKLFTEFGLFSAWVSDKKIDNDFFVIKKSFYSVDGKTFSETPANNTYRISYRQETFPTWGINVVGTIGVGYILGYN